MNGLNKQRILSEDELFDITFLLKCSWVTILKEAVKK